jgi:ABC-2 type transport system permease protein
MIASLGVRTLFTKEVRRFLRVSGQTILSPLITTTLYFVVFGYSMGSRIGPIEGVPYARFIVPGLVTLGVVSNAFLNTSSSLFMMKMMGTITDLLVTPLSYMELLEGFIGAGVVRGLMVGALMWFVAGVFTGFQLAHPLLVLVFLVEISVGFAAMGLCVAVWAEKFEQVNFVPTFVITPLTFLGGVFTPKSFLAPAMQTFTAFNPLFYMVDMMRYAMLGISDTSPVTGFTILSAITVVSVSTAFWMLRSGWKLRG